MSRVIGVMGESGSGKTTAMRNLPPAETFYIDSDLKGLNWRGWRDQYKTILKSKTDEEQPKTTNYVATDDFKHVLDCMSAVNSESKYARIKYLVIDTLNGMMVAQEMRILGMTSGDKRSSWSDLAENGWEVLTRALKMRDDLTIIILCHSETVSDDNGIVKTRIKTNGRKLEKLVLESKMTTIVWALRKDGKYKFVLSADGVSCKVPLGAFGEGVTEIDNDIMLVIDAIKDF